MLTVYVASGEPIWEDIQKMCNTMEIKCYNTKMHVGDIIITYTFPETTNDCENNHQISKLKENLPNVEILDNTICLVIIERKTIADFCSSLGSNRKKEQNLRLLQFRNDLIRCSQDADNLGIRMYFVIEGYIQLKDLGETTVCRKQVTDLESAFTKLQLRDNIHVQQVCSMEEHIAFILGILKIFNREPRITGGFTDLCQEYTGEALKIKKKENLTGSVVFLTQLTCYPGVSMDTAKAIASTYSSFKQLISAFENADKPEKMLQDLPVVNGKSGNSRRLGPAKAKYIYEQLMND